MVNVLYLHNSSLISGGERSLLQLWANLDRTAYAPHVLLPGDGIFAREIRSRGIDVDFMDVPPLRPWTLTHLMRAARVLERHMRRKEIRLVHSYAPRNNLLASWVAHKMHVPVIWHERNMIWRHEQDVSRIFLSWADAVICNSAAVAGRFQVRGCLPEKVRIILNGVDAAQFVPPANKALVKERLGWGGRKVVGIVTNLEPRKGVEAFLEMAALMADKCRDVVFVVVGGCYGSGERRLDSLKRKALALGLGDNLVWVGFQPDVRPYVSAFDVSVHVTLKEACSRAILESMAMRVAVVAFADGGNGELVEDGVTGILVPAGRVDILAERLTALLERDIEISQMGQAARVRVQEVFDARGNAAATQKLYAQLLSAKGSFCAPRD